MGAEWSGLVGGMARLDEEGDMSVADPPDQVKGFVKLMLIRSCLWMNWKLNITLSRRYGSVGILKSQKCIHSLPFSNHPFQVLSTACAVSTPYHTS